MKQHLLSRWYLSCKNGYCTNCIILKKELPIDKALPYIIERGTLHRISEVGVSIRQLERLYQQRIGLSPQLYARLVRFTQAWIIKEGNPFIKWTQLAYQCGYSDQMHLIHDFKGFTGITL